MDFFNHLMGFSKGTNLGTQQYRSSGDGLENKISEMDRAMMNKFSSSPLITRPLGSDAISTSKPSRLSDATVNDNKALFSDPFTIKRVSGEDMSDHCNSSDSEFESAAESADEEPKGFYREPGNTERQSFNRMAVKLKDKVKSKLSKGWDSKQSNFDRGFGAFQDFESSIRNIAGQSFGSPPWKTGAMNTTMEDGHGMLHEETIEQSSVTKDGTTHQFYQYNSKKTTPTHVRRKTVKGPSLFAGPSALSDPFAKKPRPLGVTAETLSSPVGLGIKTSDFVKKQKDLTKELEDRFKSAKDSATYTVTKSLDDLKCLEEAMVSSLNEEAEKIADNLADSNFTDVFQDVLSDFAKNTSAKGAELMQHALQTMYSGTDVSTKLCRKFKKAKVYKNILDYLNLPKVKPETIDDSSSNFDIIKGFLGVLHNCLHRCDADEEYREVGALKIIRKFRKAKSRILQCIAEILLAYLMSEDENAQLNVDAENIKFIGHVLETALKDKDHFSAKYGFTAEEILEALNSLAASEVNKRRIVEQKLLKSYVKLLDLDNSSEKELELSARGLWLLSFTEHEAILAEPDCVKRLELVREKCGSPKARNKADGALWLIRQKTKKNDPVPQTAPAETIKPVKRAEGDSSSDEDSCAGHVMISYQWDVQPIMLKVRDRLQAEGYDVWMDVDNMSGSILEAMAKAVEDASVVVMALSEKYKKSPNCRTEGEYAYRCQKGIIPLLMQRRYRPDGWLGAIIGNKLYFDLSQEEKFKKSLDAFLVELARFFGKEVDETPDRPQSANSTSSAAKTTDVSNWSEGDVKVWLSKNGLSQHAKKFAGMNGSLLLEMKGMFDRAPESFYISAKDQLRLSFMDILRLTKAMNQLD